MNINELRLFLKSSVRGNMACLACAVLAPMFMLLPVTAPGQSSGVLTNLGQVQALSLAEGKEGRPVKLQATVTYCDPEWRMMFIQDDTGSAYLERRPPSNDPSWKLHAGQLVDLEGVTSAGVVQCNINEQSLQAAGQGRLPVPWPLNSEESFRKAHDACWVRTAGFISGV